MEQSVNLILKSTFYKLAKFDRFTVKTKRTFGSNQASQRMKNVSWNERERNVSEQKIYKMWN